MEDESSVSLDNFRKDFSKWLESRFSDLSAFQDWHAGYLRESDFRVRVNAHIDFIHREAVNLPNSKQQLKHSLWADCMANGMTFVSVQPQVVEHTLVTPEVYECFRDMHFGEQIRSMSPAPQVKVK